MALESIEKSEVRRSGIFDTRTSMLREVVVDERAEKAITGRQGAR